MQDAATGRNSLGTVENAFQIIEWLQENDGGRVSEVADHFDLPRSTTHNYLSTLLQCGYLSKEGDEYHINLKFLCLGGHAATRKRFYELTKPKVQKIALETGERVQFIAEENGRGIYVHEAMGDKAVRTDVRIGKVSYLHTMSAGKAILARMDEERVREIIDRWGLPRKTENTITDESALFTALEDIRERGYAVNREERTDRQRAVGVAIRAPDSDTIGAISVSGPSHRLQDERFSKEVPDLLLGIKDELHLNLKHS